MGGDLEFHSLLNLDRYPLDRLGEENGREVVRHCAAELRNKGMCKLEDFIRPSGLAVLGGEANALSSRANHTMKYCNAYFTPKNPDLPDDDARNIMTPRGMGMVASDLIPEESALQRLYRWAPIRTFLAKVLGKETIHTLGDRYQALNISVMPAGPGHNWHFDDPDFVVTLMLQKPVVGGDFECVPDIRSETDQNYLGVRAVLLGDRKPVQVVPFQPGTLMIFHGHNSLHRVSPVEGEITRLVAVFSYSTQPNYHGEDVANRLVYGERAMPASAQA